MKNTRLRLRMLEKFGSQVDFSQVAEVNETIISKVLNGRRKLRPEEQLRWAGLLGCNTDIFKADI